MSAPSLTTYTDGQGTIFADGLNTFEQTCDTFADLQNFVGIQGIQVNVRGGSTIGDGLGGSFYWDSDGTANDGVNNIQPTGAAIGTWTRVSGDVNSVLFPFEQATTLAAARTALGLGTLATQNGNVAGWINLQKTVSSTYTVQSADAGLTILLTGGFYQVTFSSVGSYSTNFLVVLANVSSRGKGLNIGSSYQMLWPGQTIFVYVAGSVFGVIGGDGGWSLPASENLYVNTSGASTNDGLGSDFPLDLQSAINLCTNGTFNFRGKSIVIQLADGTYTGQFNILGGMIGQDVFIIQGNVATPTNTKIVSSGAGVDTIFARDAGRVMLQNLELACGASGSAISVSQGGIVDIGNVIFGDCSGANVMAVQEGGAINFEGPLTINGNFSSWIFMQGGYVSLGGQTITFQSAVTGTYLLDMVRGGVESNAGAATFVNPSFYTGTSYNVTANAVFVRNGTTLPGSSGSTATGGQVI